MVEIGKQSFFTFLLLVAVTSVIGMVLYNNSNSGLSENSPESAEEYMKVLIAEGVDGKRASAVHNHLVNPDNLRHATYKRHIDGDTGVFKILNPETMKYEEKKVRYLLIDTPETKHPKKSEQPFGEAASLRSKELLENAEIIEIEYDKGDRTDRYERDLAYIFVDGELLQGILVEEGLAVVDYVYPPNDKYVDLLLMLEDKAKQANNGVWSLDGSFEDYTVDEAGRAVRLN